MTTFKCTVRFETRTFKGVLVTRIVLSYGIRWEMDSCLTMKNTFMTLSMDNGIQLLVTYALKERHLVN